MNFSYKYYDIKRRLMAFTLAGYLGVTSVSLTACNSNKVYGSLDNGYYDVIERDNNIKKYVTNGWFCDVWAEDYDDVKITGAKFELWNSSGDLIDEWVGTDTPYRITGLEEGTYTLVETPPKDYMTANENYSFKIEVDQREYTVLAIKHVNVDKCFGENISNVLSSGIEEDISDKYFVLKLKDSYINRMNNKDYLQYDNKDDLIVDELPSYIILKGSNVKENWNNISEGSLIYSFNDVVSFRDSDFSMTDISLICNRDGSYQTIIYSSYLGLKGSIYNMSLFMKPLSELTKEEMSELIDEYKNDQEIMSFLEDNNFKSTNKIRVLKKN